MLNSSSYLDYVRIATEIPISIFQSPIVTAAYPRYFPWQVSAPVLADGLSRSRSPWEVVMTAFGFGNVIVKRRRVGAGRCAA